MPIYDYVCSNCSQRTEVIHGIHDPGPRFCPSCGAEGTLKKGFTTPAIHFKGSGWAKKDRSATRTPKSSKSSDSGDTAGGSSSSSSSSPANGSTGSDSKPSQTSDSGSTAKPSAGGTGGD